MSFKVILIKQRCTIGWIIYGLGSFGRDGYTYLCVTVFTYNGAIGTINEQLPQQNF